MRKEDIPTQEQRQEWKSCLEGNHVQSLFFFAEHKLNCDLEDHNCPCGLGETGSMAQIQFRTCKVAVFSLDKYVDHLEEELSAFRAKYRDTTEHLASVIQETRDDRDKSILESNALREGIQQIIAGEGPDWDDHDESICDSLKRLLIRVSNSAPTHLLKELKDLQCMASELSHAREIINKHLSEE